MNMENIIGKRVLLRDYRIEDITKIYNWNKNSITTKYMGAKYRNQRSLEEIEKSVIGIISDPPKDGLFYVIADKSTEEYLGGIDLTSIDWIDGNGILSVVIAEDKNRNKGIGTEAVLLIIGHAFKEKNLHKIELRVNSENIAAIQCYKRAGFKIEGTIRDHQLINGKYSNLHVMGILENEYSNE
jgi:RimJ/RimL family protein N-acetyltransferase